MPPKPNMRRRGSAAVPAVVEDGEQRPVAAHQAHAEPGRPNPYPHRLSVDVDANTYRTLRLIAAQEGCRLVDVVRAAIAHEIELRQ
jgi:hypothetical protein